MAVLDTYANLTTAIGTWGVRTYSDSQTDEFILLAEAQFNRKLRQDFRRRSSATVTTNASGVATLPTGFVGMTSLVQDVSGGVPLKQVSWDALITRNPLADADDAQVYAINGTTLMVAPVAADDFTAKFSATLSGLTSSNTTNWLLTLAPDVYLFMCRAMQAAFAEEFDVASVFKSQAVEGLDELVSQGNVAEYGNAEMTMDMVTP